jgi:hypothetical protein
MRIIAVVCILIGILIPTLVIYVDQQVAVQQDIRVEILSIEEAALPTPVPSITLLQNKSQVEQFMLADTTNQNPYTDTYKCGNFANDVVVNATAKGIEAKVIIVLWVGSYVPHAIVVFPTAEGDIYVDATSGDWWVNFGLGDSEYNSYLMTDSTQFGFKDKTVAMYGIKDNGYTNWLYVRPLPTPTPTIEPTPVPIVEPIPIPTVSYTIDTLTKPQLLNREQVKWFMLYDQTDKHPYTPDFMCGAFATTVVTNASVIGIDARYVILFWQNKIIPHAIVMFPTLEDGEVFVDATCGDWWVEMNYGEGNYKSYSMTNPDVHWFYGDTLTSFEIYY